MYVTVLPVASKTYFCSPKANSTSALLVTKRVFQLISGFGLSINGKHTYCGDYVYSGHTVIHVLSYLIINECEYIIFYYPILSNLNVQMMEAVRRIIILELVHYQYLSLKRNYHSVLLIFIFIKES